LELNLEKSEVGSEGLELLARRRTGGEGAEEHDRERASHGKKS
jgi:hypothetical protein